MVSGSAAATNADTIIYNVMYAFYIACSSFMGQNYGAGNKKESSEVTLSVCFIHSRSD